MDGYDSIEAYIRDDKFSKLSPDAKTYKVQVKSQTPHASDEKETEKKHVTEKTKGNVCDVANTPEMTSKQSKSRRQRKKGRLPSEVGKLLNKASSFLKLIFVLTGFFFFVKILSIISTVFAWLFSSKVN